MATRWLKLMCLAVGLAVVCGMSANSAWAALIVEESFDYGAGGGSVIGLNGGTGFSGPWFTSGQGATYQGSSLTFGSLQTRGGSLATLSDGQAWHPERPLSAAVSNVLLFDGITYGSFLVRKTVTDTTVGAALYLGQAGDAFASSANKPGLSFESRNPDAAAPNQHAAAAIESDRVQSSGLTIAGETTYLYLFKSEVTLHNFLDLWILTADQYDNFIAGGLDEGELNAAALGTGASNVYDRISTASNGTYDPITHLGIVAPFSNVAYDEIRLSTTSLTEAAPAAVPEPASLTLFAAGASMVLRRRRA
jgi:hypothetical protein